MQNGLFWCPFHDVVIQGYAWSAAPLEIDSLEGQSSDLLGRGKFDSSRQTMEVIGLRKEGSRNPLALFRVERAATQFVGADFETADAGESRLLAL